MILAEPFSACVDLENADDVKGKIVMLERGQCMFIDKVNMGVVHIWYRITPML